MATPVQVVFDIGKTNKKYFIFDENYKLLQKQQTTLAQIEDEDGYPCEDLNLLERWLQNKLQSTLRDKNFNVQSVNFSAYGASLVHLDEQGNSVTPLYNYLKPYPRDLLDELYNKYGGRKKFALQTASPPMGMLNSGLQLYWLKHKKPVKFAKVHRSLHFPQYLSFLLTGKHVADQTSIGCHTGLWNFKEASYHQWLKQENLEKLLPDVHSVSTSFNVEWEGAKFKTGIGIHDSSAALVPYLHILNDPFMLVSTGTWSISLNPFNKEPLTYNELRKDCLCYMDIEGNQVKASRLFLGEEYKYQVKQLSEHFEVENYQEAVDLDKKMIQRLVNSQSPTKLELAEAHNSGPFPQDKPGEWQIENFTSYKEAYHQLMLDLVAIQIQSIELAQGLEEVDQLIISGGFSQNDFYVTLLASFLPDKKIYTASLPHASAMGAAMVIDEDKDDLKGKEELLGLTLHPPEEGLGVEQYRWKEPVAS